jgi:hypothetical protein
VTALDMRATLMRKSATRSPAPRENMAQIGRNLLAALLVVVCTSAMAGPAEDASAAIDRWAAAYSSNDPETITKLYAPNAILLGTVSPVMSIGPEAILKYFEAVRGTGNTVTIGERKFIVLANDAVLATGFYRTHPARAAAEAG